MRCVPLTTGVRPAKNRRAHSVRPHLEILEDRVVPSADPTAGLVGYATLTVEVVPSSDVASMGGPGQPGGFSPQQISQAYGFNQIYFNNGTIKGDGAGQTIAIVDAYNQPDIVNDLHTFDATYGLPDPPSFRVVNQNGGTSLPAADQSWGLEISLDVEWAHAMAPGANILLVESNTNSYADLTTASNYARNQPDVSVVSMSWGGNEWSSESYYDNYFTTPAGHPGVTFVASSGDAGSAGAPEFPSVSPNVLAVGGTQLTTDTAGHYLGEVGWSGSGGGISTAEPQPSYQQGVVNTGGYRAVPDVAYNGSVSSPFAVYDTSSYNGWIEVYGTSAGAPQWAGLIAIANQGRALAGKAPLDGPSQTLPMLYQLPQSDFHDITSGSNGSYWTGPGYDLVTGRGSPIANLVVAGLVSPGGSTSSGPWVVAPASASANPVAGTTTNLSVAGNDSSGAANLTYTWSVLAAPSGVAAPTFSVNGTNAAQNTTVTFYGAGQYTFQVTLQDPRDFTTASNVVVTVNQTLSNIVITPGSANVSNGASLQLTATALDQFGHVMNVQPNWTLSGAGSLNGNGVYTAPALGSGTSFIQVSAGGMTFTAAVAFAPPPATDPWTAWLNLVDAWMTQLSWLQSLWSSLLTAWHVG
jgi:subtilase family serine protease